MKGGGAGTNEELEENTKGWVTEFRLASTTTYESPRLKIVR